MSARRKGRRRGSRPKPVDLWRPVPQLPELEPIRPADDPTMLLESLGSPPLPGLGQRGGHTFELVIQRSAMLATALASTADLLVDDEVDDPPGRS